MSIPLFLDSDAGDREFDRFVYWTLQIKNSDLEYLCANPKLNEEPLTDPLFSGKLSIQIIWSQLVIRGIRWNAGNEFGSMYDFMDLFGKVYEENEKKQFDYYIIDAHYVYAPRLGVTEGKKNGSVFRISDSDFTNLLYDKEMMSFSSSPSTLKYSKRETEAYENYMEDLISE